MELSAWLRLAQCNCLVSASYVLIRFCAVEWMILLLYVTDCAVHLEVFLLSQVVNPKNNINPQDK